MKVNFEALKSETRLTVSCFSDSPLAASSQQNLSLTDIVIPF